MDTNVFVSYLASSYGWATVLGIVFIIVTQSALRDLVRKLTLTIKNKNVSVTTQQSQQPEDVVQTKDYEKIQSVLRELDIQSSDELEEFLSEVYEHNQSQSEQIKQAEKATKALIELKETYEFAYLNLFFVDDTKLALLYWFEQGAITKDFFDQAFVLNQETENAPLEKEAIFNTLLSNDLLEQEKGALYQVSDKGKRFLEYTDDDA